MTHIINLNNNGFMIHGSPTKVISLNEASSIIFTIEDFVYDDWNWNLSILQDFKFQNHTLAHDNKSLMWSIASNTLEEGRLEVQITAEEDSEVGNRIWQSDIIELHAQIL